MLVEYLDWSEEQWDRYEATRVSVPLEQVGKLLTACELLRDGRRLNSKEREAWRALIKELFPGYLALVLKISRGGNMTQYVDYSSHVPADLREMALVVGIIDEAGDISRQCCTCNERRWGWMLHAGSCPVYAYHNAGGVRAAHILESLLKETIT